MSIAQRPDLFLPSSESAINANCAKYAESANYTNYAKTWPDFTFFRFLQNLQNMQNVQIKQIVLRSALISPSSGSSCRASCSSSAHPPLAISVSREEELQLLASPGNRVAKVVIDQLGQLVWLAVVLMFMLMFVLICVVRFLNPVSPTSIVPFTMFLSSLLYTWATKKTGVSKWKKTSSRTQAQVRACLSVDAAEPAFKHARSDLVSLAGLVQ